MRGPLFLCPFELRQVIRTRTVPVSKTIKRSSTPFLKYPVYTWLVIEQRLARPSGSMHFGDVLQKNDRQRNPKLGLED